MNLINGDCIEELKILPENTIDTCITDPPYGINMASWDKFGKNATDALEMLQEFTFNWASEAYRVLKPGAILLCFSSSKTYHRITMGIEEAGFTIRECMTWLYSGFPKVSNIGKLIENTGEEDSEWSGYYSGLKPSLELIIVGMKPLDKNYANNAIKWGVAGFDIENNRTPSDEKIRICYSTKGWTGFGNIKRPDYKENFSDKGRYPSQITHDGSDIVLEKLGSASPFYYCAKPSKKEKNLGLQEGTNNHVSVKPIELLQYLVRLTKPPSGGVVLDPFMGSGTTGCACVIEGRDFIGIEKEKEYFEIAKQRIDYWQRRTEEENRNEVSRLF